MPYEYLENSTQNSFVPCNGANQVNNFQQFCQPSPQPYSLQMPPIWSFPSQSPSMVHAFPNQIYQSQMIMTPKHILNDPHVNLSEVHFNRKGSPIGTPPIPTKRQKLNEINNDIDLEYWKSDSNSNHSSTSNEGINVLEVDSIFYELQSSASNGCSFAENVAKNYRKRPCFKKIELLLSRLRQELHVHHNIQSNINSQGTAWAIKDFIFVFSRVVNAWTILRGYVYDNADGLNPLRQQYDENFISNFMEWQQSTLKLMNSLMSTVENLDVLTQNKSGNKQKRKEVYVNTNTEIKEYDKEFLENFQRNLFTPKYMENSDQTQIKTHRDGSYFRAGILKPLTMPAPFSPTSSISSMSPMSPDPLEWLNYDDFSDNSAQIPKTMSFSSGGRLYNRRTESAITPLGDANVSGEQTKSRAKKDLSNKFNNISVYNHDIEAQLEREFLKIDMDDNEELIKLENAEAFLNRDDEKKKIMQQMYKDEGLKIFYLINEVAKLPHAEDLTISINMIVENVWNGKFGNMQGIMDEFKGLIKQAKNLAQNSKENEMIPLKKFINSLESVINRKAFE